MTNEQVSEGELIHRKI